MPTTTTYLSKAPLQLTATNTAALTDGILTLRYAISGGAAVFECGGQTATSGWIELPPAVWLAWLREGIDLVVEPSSPSPALLVRVTDVNGRLLCTTDGEPTAVTGTSRLSVHLLFASPEGMSFKVAVDGAGSVNFELGGVTKLRPPPPKLPPDPPIPN